jgi:hypothetical protein
MLGSMITRGGEPWLWKHPGPIPSGETVQCDGGDTAVAFDCGAAIGAFGSGQHPVSGSAIEVYFVRPIALIKIGTRMPVPGGQLSVFGEAQLRVTDPVKLIVSVVGVGGADPSAGVERYAQQKIITALRPALARPRLDEPAVSAALESIPAAIADGLELDRFVHLTVKSPNGDVTVRPPAAPAEPTPGTPVWACWTDGGWYPATVRAVEAGGYVIEWESSGNTAVLPLDHLKPR